MSKIVYRITKKVKTLIISSRNLIFTTTLLIWQTHFDFSFIDAITKLKPRHIIIIDWGTGFPITPIDEVCINDLNESK